MQIKEHFIYFKSLGNQLSFSVLFLVFCSIGFFIIDAFEKAGYLNLILSIIKGVFAAGGAYLLFYSVILSKELTEKYYKNYKIKK